MSGWRLSGIAGQGAFRTGRTKLRPAPGVRVKLIAYRDACGVTMARVLDGGRLAVVCSPEEFWSAPPVGLAAARHATAGCTALDEVEQLPPVPLTAHVLCAGRNYAAHAAEANLRVPKNPDLFGRWPSTLV